MIRKIIKINEELCNGCGLCVNACHESAIGLVNGKAKLLRDDYCDGLGDCLPVCPTDAISFEEREALEYNEEEVKQNILKKQLEEKKNSQERTHVVQGGCPGSRARSFTAESENVSVSVNSSMLRQWPVQIQLVAPNASFFQNSHLLIAADCCAYSHGDFHKFMKNKVTVIGCPKLDEVDYADKLTEILINNEIKSITVTRMEVPCCGGIVHAVKTAMQRSGKIIPWKVIVLSVDGKILEEN